MPIPLIEFDVVSGAGGGGGYHVTFNGDQIAAIAVATPTTTYIEVNSNIVEIQGDYATVVALISALP
jgi:hypothetical protein